MGVMRFCNAAGCREVIPVGQYYCDKHQYLQKEYEERKRTIPLRVDTLNNKSVNPRGCFAL